MKGQEEQPRPAGHDSRSPEGPNRALAGGLYVVATPIGNLEDLGFRALRVLKNVDWVAAEDTRETRKLLDHYGVSATLHALHEHSTKARIEELVTSLREGGRGAYVSDAGTPGLCDPGPGLVAACVREGVPVYPVPGASALLALLSVSGLPGSAFRFSGFFPREKKEREEWGTRAAAEGGLHVFYESPHRIQGALEFLAGRFPAAPLVVGRELTKRFETVSRGAALEIHERLAAEEPRGEYVLALELPAAEARAGIGEEEVRALVKELAQLGAPQKALLRVGMSHGLRKNEAYRLSLEALENGAPGP
jgi:16S rRNA (cytidine1402-2'-O)-methyltransferase